jgi:hypothetical protein
LHGLFFEKNEGESTLTGAADDSQVVLKKQKNYATRAKMAQIIIWDGSNPDLKRAG